MEAPVTIGQSSWCDHHGAASMFLASLSLECNPNYFMSVYVYVCARVHVCVCICAHWPVYVPLGALGPH